MVFVNDSNSTDPQRDPKKNPDFSQFHQGKSGLYTIAGAVIVAAAILVAFFVGVFDSSEPTGAIRQQQTPPAQTEPAQPPQ